jgi:ankyrin repeat protein
MNFMSQSSLLKRFLRRNNMRISRLGLAVATALGASNCAGFFEEPGSALAEAAHRGDLAAIRTLVASGADPNAYDATGNTPLHWAARGGHPIGPHRCQGEAPNRPDVVGALIDLGADPNALDHRQSIPGGSSGWTPLHMALHHEQFRTAATLLERGADPNIRTQQGHMSLSIAADEGAPKELLAVLLSKGFDPQAARIPERR